MSSDFSTVPVYRHDFSQRTDTGRREDSHPPMEWSNMVFFLTKRVHARAMVSVEEGLWT